MDRSFRTAFVAAIGIYAGFILAFLVKGLWTGIFNWERIINISIGGVIGLFMLYLIANNLKRNDEEE